MKFYHCFHTELPDQFVEATANKLRSWVGNWPDNPYVIRSKIIDGVQINMDGKQGRDGWPTLTCTSQRMLDLWMKNKGKNYDGRYWESLTEDQRNPVRVASDPGRDDADDALYTWGSIPWARTPTGPARSGRQSMSVTQWLAEREERPRPALKRDGVIAGEIVGYRCWRLKGDLLQSVYQADVWRPGEVLEGRELGDWDQRGIHAWRDAGSKQYHEYIRSYLNNLSDTFAAQAFLMLRALGHGGDPEPRDPRPAMVTGTVFLWGDVVEHERGWRAEYARVRSLDWLYPNDKMMGREQAVLSEFRQRYGVQHLRGDQQ